YPRLDSLELVPFRAGIAAGAGAVMSAHIAFPAFTGSDEPATLSGAVLTGLLRDSLHFQGLVVTDALMMVAIASKYGAGEAAVRGARHRGAGSYAGARLRRGAARVARGAVPPRADRVRGRDDRDRGRAHRRRAPQGGRHGRLLPSVADVGDALLRLGACDHRPVATGRDRCQRAPALVARYDRTPRLAGPAHHGDRRDSTDRAGLARQP